VFHTPTAYPTLSEDDFIYPRPNLTNLNSLLKKRKNRRRMFESKQTTEDPKRIDLVSSHLNINKVGTGNVHIGNMCTPTISTRSETAHIVADSLHLKGTVELTMQSPHTILLSDNGEEILRTFARTGTTGPSQEVVMYNTALPWYSMVYYDITVCGQTVDKGGMWVARGLLRCNPNGKTTQSAEFVRGTTVGKVLVKYDAEEGFFIVTVRGEDDMSWVVNGRITICPRARPPK
jgi:hypothetical protein